MSNNVTVTNRDNLFGLIETSSYPLSEIVDAEGRISTITNGSFAKAASATLVDYQKMSTIKEASFSIINISNFLPFRVSFTNITVKPYDVNNPAPLGVAIIGTNNYIL
jgi:hypothetical protein